MTPHLRSAGYAVIVLLVGLLTACTYALNNANTIFTSDNVMRLKVGMTTDEVITLFRRPNRIERSTCGGKTPGGPWPCIVWEYDVEESSDGYVTTRKTNTLTFNGNYDPPRLNDWTIERIW